MIIRKSDKLLDLLVLRLEEWENYYEKHSKNKMIEYNLSYPILKMGKAKLKNKILGFMKRKKFEEM